MSVELRETTITPAQAGDVVQLYISDAERGDEEAEIVLQFHVRLGKRHKNPLLTQVQRDALKIARDHVSDILQGLAQAAQEGLD
jgi:hypothetical protein